MPVISWEKFEHVLHTFSVTLWSAYHFQALTRTITLTGCPPYIYGRVTYLALHGPFNSRSERILLVPPDEANASAIYRYVLYLFRRLTLGSFCRRGISRIQ